MYSPYVQVLHTLFSSLQDRVSLSWVAPTNDGGAPISEYIIEKKSKHDREWKEALKVHGAQTEGEVLGLKEGEEYQFRVKAVNKVRNGSG